MDIIVIMKQQRYIICLLLTLIAIVMPVQAQIKGKPNMTMDKFIYNYMDGWNTDGARKATVEEIIKHFKN